MKKYSKRLLCSCISAIGLIGTYSLAGTTGMSITLAPGWNVVSTPAILSSLSFSNGGNGISFSKLVNEKRQTVSATTENIKPLEGFMVNNSNTSAVTLTMQYKAGVSVTESLLKSDLNQGRNLLGITTIDHPFAHLTGASMSVDFTNGSNQGVSSNFTINTTSKEVTNPQLGKAYGIFVNTQNAIYGGVNNGGIAIDEESTGGNTGANTGSNNGTNTGDEKIDLIIEYHSNRNKQLLKGETRNIGFFNLNYDNTYRDFRDINISSITFHNKGSINHNEITSIYLENENKERISDIQSFGMDKKVTLTINSKYSHMTGKNYIMITVDNTSVTGHTIQLSMESVVGNVNLKKETIEGTNIYRIVDFINCHEVPLSQACLVEDEDCPQVCLSSNSGEIGSGTTVTSGINEGVIFQNKLNDVVIYSGNMGGNSNGDTNIRYTEDKNSLYYVWDLGLGFPTNDIIIASGNIDTNEAKTMSFTITGYRGTDASSHKLCPGKMYVKIGEEGYTSDSSYQHDTDQCSWNFQDVTIYPNASFFITLRSSSFGGHIQFRTPSSFSVDNKELGLEFRKFIFEDRDLFTVTSGSSPKLNILQGEKESHVVYSGKFITAIDLIIDSLNGTENSIENQTFFHVYVDEQEIWNSDYNTGNNSIFGTGMTSFSLPAGIHTITVIEDFLILNSNSQHSSVSSLSLGATMTNGNKYTIYFGNGSEINTANVNSNSLTADTSTSYQKCIFNLDQYKSCEVDSEGNSKIIVFSGSYAAKDKPIILTGFMVNHLTGKNFDNIHLSFELYINDVLVKTFGMDQINQVLSLDNIEIPTTATSVKLLAIPSNENKGTFKGSLIFYWRYKDNSGTPRHDSIVTRDDVYPNKNYTILTAKFLKENDKTIPIGGVVVIDSIKFSTKSEVDINAITLQLFNMDYTGAISVWLEHEGNMISSEENFKHGSQIRLSLKNRFSTVKNNEVIDLVVKLENSIEDSSQIAFKIIKIESTADMNKILDGYDTSSTGTAISYTSPKVNFNMVNSGSIDYVVGSQSGYEMARFTIENTSKREVMLVKAITLTNEKNGNMTNLSNLKILSNGEEVSSNGIVDNYKIVFSLDDSINTGTVKEYVVYANMDTRDRNRYTYQFYPEENTDISVVERTSNIRAIVELGDTIYGSVYRFKEN